MLRSVAAAFGVCAVCLPSGCKNKSEQKPEKAPAATGAAAKGITSASPSTPAVAAPEKKKGPPEPLNVLFITVDSLRADMPWTGYSRPIAPNLTKLAEQSVVYENAYALSSYTAKSVAGFLTGRYPSTLYRDGMFFAKYPLSNLFLQEVLRDKGVATIGWHGHMYFGRGKGLEQGFSEWELVPGITFDPQTDPHVTSEKMTTLGIKLLSKPENTGKQFFAWAHYMDPHDEYKDHEECPKFGRRGRDRYDAEVCFTDLWLAKLFDWGKTQPWWKKTAIIISADHGEAFGENNAYRHAFEVWDVLTHVPLIIQAPGAEVRRIKERRSHVDLAPTILELMGEPVPPSMQGKSLVPELYGAAPGNREPIVSELTEDSHNPFRRAFILGDYKLIVGDIPKYRLYNLQKDPQETTDLSETEPAKLEEMKKAVDAFFEKLPVVDAYGGNKLKSGRTARGPMGPPTAD